MTVIKIKPTRTIRQRLKYIGICLLIATSTCTAESTPTTTATKSILVFGDSVSAAYGIAVNKGWVQLLAQKLRTSHPQYTVKNASISGETTGGGRIRLASTLSRHQPQILILELGGNDGLRGYPIDKIEANLNAMIRMTESSKIKILLIGMVLPPNYGQRYTQAFQKIYRNVVEKAQQQKIEIQFLPYLLEGVTTPKKLLQADGIHPKLEAQPLLLENIYPHLAPLL